MHATLWLLRACIDAMLQSADLNVQEVALHGSRNSYLLFAQKYAVHSPIGS